MSADPAIGHLAGDTLVRSQMAVSMQAMGADQAWAGVLPGVAQATGRGIGVALIDSGVSRHSALQGRVLLSLDFTASQGTGEDQYGHGTHVAGIIGGSSALLQAAWRRVRTWSASRCWARRLRAHERRDCGHRLGDRQPGAVRAADHQPVARPAGLRLLSDDPLCQAVERAYRAGLVVVAAAGNYGKLPDGQPVVGGITSPGNSPYAV